MAHPPAPQRRFRWTRAAPSRICPPKPTAPGEAVSSSGPAGDVPMAPKKQIIAVVGATGAQGSGLVRAILQDPERRFTARGITRKPDSEKARALAAQGVEVVAADANDV